MAKMQKFTSVLSTILKSHGLSGRLQEYRVVAQWPALAGPVLARHAQPGGLRGKKLQLIVDSPAWMHQLSLMKPELIARINEDLGTEIVKEISLKLGDIPSNEVRQASARPLRELTPEEQQKIDQDISSIHDSEVREMVRRVIAKDILTKKGQRS